jgi:hypothetical protein
MTDQLTKRKVHPSLLPCIGQGGLYLIANNGAPDP